LPIKSTNPSSSTQTLFPTKVINRICNVTISKNVASDVYYLHSTCGATEWSGILFYTVEEGDILDGVSDKPIDITLTYFFPLDIGTPGYTEFDFGETLIDIFTEHPELMTSKYGIMHTHHGMTSYFSGTDTATLHEQSPIFDYFLSVIVNFKGEIVAKLCYVTEEEEAIVSNIKYPLGRLLTKKENRTVKYLNTIDCDMFFETNIGKDVEKLKESNKKKELMRKSMMSNFNASQSVHNNSWVNANEIVPSNQLNLFNDLKGNDFDIDMSINTSIHNKNSLTAKNVIKFLTYCIAEEFDFNIQLDTNKEIKTFNSKSIAEKTSIISSIGDSVEYMFDEAFPNIDSLSALEYKVLIETTEKFCSQLITNTTYLEQCIEETADMYKQSIR